MRNKIAFLISHYSPEPQYWGMPRYYEWGKRLISEGFDVYLLCASAIHSSDLNIIEKGKDFCVRVNQGIKYVYIRTSSYSGNGLSRIKNLFDFYFVVKKAFKKLPLPTVIISETPNPLGAVAGIQYANMLKIPHIVDVVDLWPESIVVYEDISEKNPIIKMLYSGEKWIYKKSDAIIFSTPGAYDYILEHRWESFIPKDKVYYINMGIDLQENDYNRDTYTYDDPLFTNQNIFKVTYTGSVRLVNNLKLLCDAGK